MGMPALIHANDPPAGPSVAPAMLVIIALAADPAMT